MQPVSTVTTSSPHATQNTPATTEQLSQFEITKKMKDAGIIQAHLNQSSEAADNPQKLLLKAAITEINDILAPYLGENAAEKAHEDGIDFSPQATADRIIKGASGFFTSFKEHNEDLSDEDAATRFQELVAKGVEQGFEDARGILEGLKVLEGKVSEDIDSTYNIVQQHLEKLRESLLKPQNENQTPEQNLT